MACVHPDCVLEAFTVEAVFLNGTAMRVMRDSGVELGQVVIYSPGPSRSGYLREEYLIPKYAKVGDDVRWKPSKKSLLGSLVICGEVVDNFDGVPLLRVTHVAGPTVIRPNIGAVVDTGVAPRDHSTRCAARWPHRMVLLLAMVHQSEFHRARPSPAVPAHG
jgi:hypothetical protein